MTFACSKPETTNQGLIHYDDTVYIKLFVFDLMSMLKF